MSNCPPPAVELYRNEEKKDETLVVFFYRTCSTSCTHSCVSVALDIYWTVTQSLTVVIVEYTKTKKVYKSGNDS